MTSEEAAELRAMADKWYKHICYSDNNEWAIGVEAGYQFASLQLEDWLEDHDL